MKHGNSFKDRTGEQHGRWTVLRFDDSSPLRHTRWICRCQCGTIRAVSSKSFASDKSQSCGCLGSDTLTARNTTHGQSLSREYVTWSAMVQRCHNPQHPAFARYGGRGIEVCPEWRESFAQFLADMGPRPPGTSIERIRNEVGYHAENCKWGTAKEQARNRRSVRIIEFQGRALTVTEWGIELGNPWIVFSRLRRGWDEQRAVSEPAKV